MQFEFTSDDLALDFAGTVMHRKCGARDLLTGPEMLGTWITTAGLLDTPPAIDDTGVLDAIELREAIYRAAATVVDGGDIAIDDLRLLNTTAALPPIKTTLRGRGVHVRTGDLDAVRSDLARSAINLIGGGGTHRMRECVGEDCSRLFIDRSRAGTRRWCGMQICGSKAKSAAYRRRHREAAG